MKAAWAIKLEDSQHSIPLPIASRWLHNTAHSPHNISSLLLRRLLWVCPIGSSHLFPFSSVRTFRHRVCGEESCLVQGENTGDNKMNLSHGEHTACQMEQTCPCNTTEQKFLQTHNGTTFVHAVVSAVSVLCQMWWVMEGFQKINLKSVCLKNRCKTCVCVCVSGRLMSPSVYNLRSVL